MYKACITSSVYSQLLHAQVTDNKIEVGQFLVTFWWVVTPNKLWIQGSLGNSYTMTFPLLCLSTSCSHKHGWMIGCFRGTGYCYILRCDNASACMLTVHASPSILQHGVGLFISFFFFVMFARRIFTIQFRAVNCWWLAFAFMHIFFSGSFCNPSHHRKMSPFWTLPRRYEHCHSDVPNGRELVYLISTSRTIVHCHCCWSTGWQWNFQ